jgi:hypothetical protein
MPDNKEVIDIYCLVRDQVLMTSMGDIIGPDHKAILGDMDLFEVEDKRTVFLRVLDCFRIQSEIRSSKDAR